ncbi:hypothetical protein BDV96DRAFT_500069 [Lophiotrema nucula]|uniref:Transferase family-domain-containing protein n=1 Tax=Lophiotrema nucula TaxID=690887 RepID=A0A6A5YW33_9PLEO|nr:hypothetical protein BDV96DRAFT_500069 [Lophiotrema nucula]
MTIQGLHLSIIDQTIIRSYIKVLLIYPFPDPYKFGDASTALGSGLRSTLQQYPYLAGSVGPADPVTGKVTAQYPDRIPNVLDSGVFQTVCEPASYSDFDYANLKEQGMPPEVLTSDRFCPISLKDHPGTGCSAADSVQELRNGPVPALAVQVTLISGGLVLSVYAHHCLMDGAGLGVFLERYATNVQTCRPDFQDKSSTPHDHSARRRDIDALVSASKRSLSSSHCPEFQLSPISSKEAIPPAANLRAHPHVMTSRILTFSHGRLSNLRDAMVNALNKRVSVFTVLTALLWVNVARSREPALIEAGVQDQETALGIAVNLKRALGEGFEDYVGNVSFAAWTSIPISKLTAMKSQLKMSPDSSTAKQTDCSMLEAVRTISATLSELDRDWMLKRISYLSAVPDPRRLGYAFSTVNSPHFFVNDWQALGADTHWDIPGTTSSQPEFIRRPYSEGEGGAFGIILPRRRSNGAQSNYEVLVRLAEEDMARFENEMERWVERVLA